MDVYFDETVRSAIEAAYLEVGLSSFNKNDLILVNPVQMNYLCRRVIIINDPRYDIKQIERMIQRGNMVVTRLRSHKNIFGINYQPYLPRYNDLIMWDGSYFDDVTEDGLDEVNFSLGDREVYLPRPKRDPISSDNSALGLISYQLGNRWIGEKSAEFIDLDIAKTKKGLELVQRKGVGG